MESSAFEFFRDSGPVAALATNLRPEFFFKGFQVSGLFS